MDGALYCRHISPYEALSYVYTLRLIGPISYPSKCVLMVHPQNIGVIFSQIHFVTFVRI